MNEEIKEDSQILATAVIRASEFMGINPEGLSDVLLITQKELSQLLKSGIHPHSETGIRSLSFINVYRSLAVKCSNDTKFMAHFLNTENKYFKAMPIDIMKTQLGLERVLHYLEALGNK